MANFPDVEVTGQLKVFGSSGIVTPSIKEGNDAINGSAFIEGPMLVGSTVKFPRCEATLMVGSLSNPDKDAENPFVAGTLCSGTHNPYALCVRGDAAIFDNLDVNRDIAAGKDIVAQGEVKSRCGTHILSAKKNFDIPHPTKEGWRLRHTCPEGPSNDVYYRGRVTSKTEIVLPGYWEKLVDQTTITVNLTPIGAHQNVIVKRIADNKIYLQSHGNMPIDCYYHIYGTRADGERLVVEYEGDSPEDYPGDNSQYSISGYHYDIK